MATRKSRKQEEPKGSAEQEEPKAAEQEEPRGSEQQVHEGEEGAREERVLEETERTKESGESQEAPREAAQSEEEEVHYFANDGSDWTSKPSPVSTKEARAADKELDDQAREGNGFSATNEPRLANTIVEGSEESNGPEER